MTIIDIVKKNIDLFDEKFSPEWWTGFTGDIEFNKPAIESIKSFLLSSQLTLLEAIKEECEGMRREPTLCGACNMNGNLCHRCYVNRQVNSTLFDLLSKLDSEIEPIKKLQ